MCFACRVTMATDTHAEYLTVAFFSTRFACRVTMATDTHAEYLTFAFFSTRLACRVTMATDTHAEYLTFAFFSTRFACRVTMATDTHAEYLTLAFFSTRICMPGNYGYRHTPRISNIYVFFPRQQWFGERASKLLLCVYCLSCLLIRSYGRDFACFH